MPTIPTRPIGSDAAIESAILQGLLPEVDCRYRTLGTAQGRMVAGVSLGGFAALRFGVLHPDAFAFVASLSGVVEAARWTALEESFLSAPLREQADRALGAPGSEIRKQKELFDHPSLVFSSACPIFQSPTAA